MILIQFHPILILIITTFHRDSMLLLNKMFVYFPHEFVLYMYFNWTLPENKLLNWALYQYFIYYYWTNEHVYIHTYLHTHIHTYIHTQTLSPSFSHTNTRTHTHTTHTFSLSLSLTHTHTYIMYVFTYI